MRNVVYSVAMSLDGYVAGPDDETDWIPIDPEIDFAALAARFDTVLMGRRTFEAARARGGDAGMPGLRSVVVSRTLDPADHPGLAVIGGVGGELGPAVARLRAEPGRDIWLFGGGTLLRSLLGLGLVDRVEVAVIPVLLGGGVPLLPAGSARTRLRLVDGKPYRTTGTVALEYVIDRDPAEPAGHRTGSTASPNS